MLFLGLVLAVLLFERIARLEGLPQHPLHALHPRHPRGGHRVRLHLPAQRHPQHRPARRRPGRPRRRLAGQVRASPCGRSCASSSGRSSGSASCCSWPGSCPWRRSCTRPPPSKGPSWTQVLFRITIPQLATVIEFYVVIMIITMLSWVFNYVYVMTSGGPGNCDHGRRATTSTWKGFRYNLQGIAAAASVVLLAVTSVLILLRSRITGGSSWNETEGVPRAQDRREQLEAAPPGSLLLPVPVPRVLPRA